MPQNKINIKKENGITYIRCLVRKKWIQLTPEEKVRQYLIVYLTGNLNYPAKFISVEKQIKINQLTKRYDIVVYSQSLQPIILIECKASDLTLTQDNLQQLLNYNIVLRAPYFMLSNGTQHLIYHLENNNFRQINELPDKNTIFNLI